MFILFIILAVIAGLVALFFLAALFTKKAYSIRRDIVIDRPKEVVYDYLRHLQNQDQFSKWVMMDPNLKKTFTGIDGNVGFIYAWEGNKRAGKGEQEIRHLVQGERIDVEVRFEKPFKNTAQTPFTTESIGENQTKVTWGMDSIMKYPMNGMLLLKMDKMLAKDLQESLGNLKAILEKP